MLSCEVDRELPVTVLRIDGELRLATVGQVRSSLLKCLAECPPAVIVDVSAMAIGTPITLSVFGAVTQRAAEWPPVALVLVAGSSEMRAKLERAVRPWEIAICSSLTEARAMAALVPPPVRRVRRTLRPATTALTEARKLVTEACLEWELSALAMPAELIISEFVSNAVEHARTDLEVNAVLRRELLHLTVTDGSPTPPRMNSKPFPADLLTGRGLLLVDEFATAWGYLPLSSGKVVWATLRSQA